MATTQDDEKSLHKLVQLRQYIIRCQQRTVNGSDEFVIKNILKEDFNVNYKIEMRDRDFEIAADTSEQRRVEYSTVLHILASWIDDIDDIFQSMLDRGADFTVKNQNGQTALHLLLTSGACANYISLTNNCILTAHVKSKISVNPRDDNGFTHFHAACLANHVEAVTWFLDNGASVNETVNFDAPRFPGYTPLHFAVQFDCFEVAQILVSRGANLNVKEARELSLIDMLLMRRLIFHEQVRYNRRHLAHELKEVSDNEKIIKLLLDKQGLSCFHAAFTLKDLSIAESLLNQVSDINQAVPMEAPVFFPGYTAAHFASLFNGDAFKMLAMRGAKLDIENLCGSTPLNFYINHHSAQDTYNLLSCVEDWKNINLSDGKTGLLDFVRIAANLNQFRLFLQNNNSENLIVPNDSALWPGSTLLHLAVILSIEYGRSWPEKFDETIVKECLHRGLDVNAQNARGQTPMHVAFKLRKTNIVILFLEYLNQLDEVENIMDEDNLSYLHIACAKKYEAFAEKLLINSNPNVVYRGKRMHEDHIEPGWTPLHVAVVTNSRNIPEILLRRGANLHATDDYGLTPIHWLLQPYLQNYPNILVVGNDLLDALSADPVDRVVDGLGLSYLHVACAFGHMSAIDKLLDLGSNVNAVINYKEMAYSSINYLLNRPLDYLSDFSMYTPLHCATTLNRELDLVDVLVRRGADVFAKISPNSPSSCILLQRTDIVRDFIPYLWDNEEMQKCMEKRFGLTKLHIACYMKDEEAIKSVLTEGINVNVQIHADSMIFAGCTPLHLLLTVPRTKSDHFWLRSPANNMIKILLDHGADVTKKNVAGDLPIHLLYNGPEIFNDREICLNTLLNAHKDFKVNPANAEGWSYFHLACYFHEVQVVEKFLQHGSVDVNQPTDLLAKMNPGSTPLNLALEHSQMPNNDWTKVMQIVDLLLKYGANVSAKDIHGDTALHKVAESSSAGIGILEKLVSYGADIRCENVRGETPMEKWSFTNFEDYARIFQKSGCQINCWNHVTGEGYIAKLFFSRNSSFSRTSLFTEWLQSSSNAQVLDELGRTAIHNSVANFIPCAARHYIDGIDRLIKLGIDIDHQDKLGKIALHYATQTLNVPGLQALLEYGTDINIVDKNGKPAFLYAMNRGYYMIDILRLHVEKLRHLKIEVSKFNQDLANDVEKQRGIRLKVTNKFFSQVERTKTMNVESCSLTLFDFLSETHGISLYPFLTKTTQVLVDDFFESINSEKLKELDCIIRLQFRKMKARLALINPAIIALRELLGFSFPGLCEEIISFLTNIDLKNLIALLHFEDE